MKSSTKRDLRDNLLLYIRKLKPRLETDISSYNNTVPFKKILAHAKWKPSKQRTVENFRAVAKLTFGWRTEGHNAILMKNIVELLSRQSNGFSKKLFHAFHLCTMCLDPKVKPEKCSYFLPNQAKNKVSYDKLRRSYFTMR